MVKFIDKMLLRFRSKRKGLLEQYTHQSREEFEKLCNNDVERLKISGLNDEMIIASSLIKVLLQNGLGRSLGEKNILECARAGIEGWKKADGILAKMPDPSDNWDETTFDRIITGGFLTYIHEEFHINDWNVLQAIRWSFNFGAQSRAKYQTLDAYTNMYGRGELYDVKVKTLSKEELQSLQSKSNIHLDLHSKNEMKNFKTLYYRVLDTIPDKNLTELAKKESVSFMFFYGGLISNAMDQGRIHIENFPSIDSDITAKVYELYKVYVDKVAMKSVLEFSQKYVQESYVIFLLGFYCNQVSGEGQQIVPYDFDFTHFNDLESGNPAAQVMAIGQKK
jgi:hypothetical protein